MTEAGLHTALVQAWFVLSAVTFVALLRITAPYGRHQRAGWGPRLPARVGWVVMELPAVAVPVACAWVGTGSPGAWVLLGAWLLHYVHRAVVYPLRMRMGGKDIPASIVAMGLGTNVVIDWLVFRDAFTLRPGQVGGSVPALLVGGALFFAGHAVNMHSDEVLRRLRGPGETGYRVPTGGAFRWVSSPNYLGEIVEWVGFAVMAQSPAAWAFAAWTASNLVPRGLSHHRWYRETFPDYPPKRRAIVPWLW